jgi:hypothetical protein
MPANSYIATDDDRSGNSEGFDGADLKAARKLLEELGRSTAP